MKKKEIITKALLHTIAAVAYIAAVVTFMQNAEELFKDRPDAFAGVIMLMLFVISATLMGIIVFGKPALLYFDGHKKEGVSLALYTTGFLVLAFVITVTCFVLFLK